MKGVACMAYRGSDIEGCTLAALRSAKRYDRTYYVFGTHSGYRTTFMPPPASQPHMRVEPSGKVYEVHPLNGTREIAYSIS